MRQVVPFCCVNVKLSYCKIEKFIANRMEVNIKICCTCEAFIYNVCETSDQRLFDNVINMDLFKNITSIMFITVYQVFILFEFLIKYKI